MTDFLHSEIKRLLGKLPETDPSTPAYLTTLQSLECVVHAEWLDGVAALVNGEQEVVTTAAETAVPTIKKDVDAAVSVSDTAEPAADPIPEPVTKDPDYDIPDEPVQPEPVEEKPAKTYTKAEVRAALVAFRNGGGNIKAFLANFGADSFGTLEESKWAAVMEKLNA